jgi:hypothetical protein
MSFRFSSGVGSTMNGGTRGLSQRHLNLFWPDAGARVKHTFFLLHY